MSRHCNVQFIKWTYSTKPRAALTQKKTALTPTNCILYISEEGKKSQEIKMLIAYAHGPLK